MYLKIPKVVVFNEIVQNPLDLSTPIQKSVGSFIKALSD